MSYILKKCISAFLMPLPFSIAFIIIGLILLWFTKKQFLGKIITTTGLSLIIFFSMEDTSMLLLRPLETIYKPYTILDNKVKFIVVLGGGGILLQNAPIDNIIKPVGIARIIEGMRIYKETKECKLILTGSTIPGTKYTESGLKAEIAEYFGVRHEDIITISSPKDTEEEVLSLKEIIGKNPFALITSASHMYRAMGLFKKQGMNPIPAPVLLFSPKEEHRIISVPTSSNISISEQAIHEYEGLLWSWLRNRI